MRSTDHTQGHCTSPLSKIAIGTFNGDSSQQINNTYKKSIKTCILNGINVIDTAINYRNSESELAVGEIINELIVSGAIDRHDVYIITKGGFLGETYCWDLHTDNEIQLGHSINSNYINHCLNKSLSNLKLKTIDLYFLHNPEIALTYLNQEEFYEIVLQNFIMLESEVHAGNIRGYGFATWTGLRVPPTHENYIDLNRILEIAKTAACGKQHNFVGIELPLNILRNEGVIIPNQMYNGSLVSTVQFAKLHNLNVFTSNSVLYGDNSKTINDFYNFDYNLSAPQKSMLLIKSIPGITSAIVGLKKIINVYSALDIIDHPPLTIEQIEDLLNNVGLTNPTP